jgi:stage II sporulation protein D
LRSLTLPPYLKLVFSRLRPWLGAAAALFVFCSATPAQAGTLFYIRGGGDGHGIGMSQYGAYGYALHGYSYRSILAHYYQGTSIGHVSPNQTVRVLLASGRASFSGAGSAGRTKLRPGWTYYVHAVSGGRLQVVNGSNRAVGASTSAPLTVQGSGPLTVPGKGSYRGSLQFRPNGSGGVQTVNAVGLDQYVRGVVADEMPASWSAQALETQAVAARTYAITTSVNGSGFSLYDDTRSQMYGGVGAETSSTNSAVSATGGQVVTYHGQPVVTYFFSSSGGHTESIQNVWPGATPEPWLRGVPDPYDGAGGDPFHSWGKQMSLAAAARKLGRLLHGRLVGVRVTEHGASPRILRAQVVGTKGTGSVSGTTLQDDFGLLTTYAAFTTITTNASSTALSGSVYPGRKGGVYWVQELEHGWQTIAKGTLPSSGRYKATIRGSGRYRIRYNKLGGPAVNVH